MGVINGYNHGDNLHKLGYGDPITIVNYMYIYLYIYMYIYI